MSEYKLPATSWANAIANLLILLRYGIPDVLDMIFILYRLSDIDGADSSYNLGYLFS